MNQKWVVACGGRSLQRNVDWEPVLCNNHFAESDFEGGDLRHQLAVGKRQKLKRGAVPSLGLVATPASKPPHENPSVHKEMLANDIKLEDHKGDVEHSTPLEGPIINAGQALIIIKVSQLESMPYLFS